MIKWIKSIPLFKINRFECGDIDDKSLIKLSGILNEMIDIKSLSIITSDLNIITSESYKVLMNNLNIPSLTELKINTPPNFSIPINIDSNIKLLCDKINELPNLNSIFIKNLTIDALSFDHFLNTIENRKFKKVGLNCIFI